MATIKVILSVPERVNFPTIMPLEGSLAEVDLINNLNERIQLSEKEVEEFKFAWLPNGRFAYDPVKGVDGEFTFESFEILLIQQGIAMHDARKTLKPWNANLAKKFKAIRVTEKKK
jgi:hypothetical protein